MIYNELPELHEVRLSKYTKPLDICVKFTQHIMFDYVVVIKEGNFNNQGLYVSVKRVTSSDQLVKDVYKSVHESLILSLIKIAVEDTLSMNVCFITGTD